MVDPDLESTGAVPVRIAGIDGLQMDVDAVVGDWTPFAGRCGYRTRPTGGGCVCT
ncbi:MAG TPA: hypothetical protein VFP67_03210 [Acidimicrobiia bacterium]|nr:hypothetical protein [Acidimicrobiia bacterium]